MKSSTNLAEKAKFRFVHGDPIARFFGLHAGLVFGRDRLLDILEDMSPKNSDVSGVTVYNLTGCGGWKSTCQGGVLI